MAESFDTAVMALQDGIAWHDSHASITMRVFQTRSSVDAFRQTAPDASDDAEAPPALYSGVDEDRMLYATLSWPLRHLLGIAQRHTAFADSLRCLVRVAQSEKGGPVQAALLEARMGVSPYNETESEAGERRYLIDCRSIWRKAGKTHQPRLGATFAAVAGSRNIAVSIGFDAGGEFVVHGDDGVLQRHIRAV